MTKTVLSVGSGSKQVELPKIFDEYQKITLDIDPTVFPDICMDARNLIHYNEKKFDAIYNSHNLEHFRFCDIQNVLDGFYLVLNDNGFAVIIVPDIYGVLKWMFENNLDLDAIVYEVPRGVVTIRDMIWGHTGEIRIQKDTEWFIHKTGFSKRLLQHLLYDTGFKTVIIEETGKELVAVAWKQELTYVPELDLGTNKLTKDNMT